MKNNKFKLRIYTRERDENNNDICDIHLISHNEVNLIQLSNIKKSNTKSNFEHSNFKNYNNNENNKKIFSYQSSTKKLLIDENNKLLKNKIIDLKKQIKSNNLEMEKKSKQFILKINTLKEINKKLLKDYNNNQNDLERIDELNGEFALLKNKLCQLNEKIDEKNKLIKDFDEKFKKDKINLENNMKNDEEKINNFYNKIFEDFDNNKILFDVDINIENNNNIDFELFKIIFFCIIKFNYNKIENFVEKLFNNNNINFDNFFDDFLNLLNVKINDNNIKHNDINYIKMFLLNYFYLNKNLNIKYISYEKLKEILIEDFNLCKYDINNININEIKNIFQNDYNIDNIIKTIKQKYDKDNLNTIFIIKLINILKEINENSNLFLNKNLFSFFINIILDYIKNNNKNIKNINYFIFNYQQLFEYIQNI